MFFFKRASKRKLMVIGLDGFPYPLLLRLAESGEMPFLSSCFSGSAPQPMTSVIPAISSVAWATYMTGRNPGRHNIFGFIDRSLSPFELTITNARAMEAPTLWRTLSDRNIPVIVMNVPVTFPPEPVNGCLVSGFLGVDLKSSVYPPGIHPMLESMGYRIDADTSAEATADKAAFITALEDVMNRRVVSFQRLLRSENWRFAQLHIMETDRLFHFAWSAVTAEDGEPARRFKAFMRRLDGHLAELASVLDDTDGLLLLSDHGFQTSETEVQLNTFLIQTGFLKRRGAGGGLSDMDPSSRAYSLIPGRIFLNRRHREPNGSVTDGDAPRVIDDLIGALEALVDPAGRPVCRRIYRREDIYSGPRTENAAELIIDPAPGIELKSAFREAPLFAPSRLEGCHTFDNAFVWCRNGTLTSQPARIIDLHPSILSFFKLQDPGSEGRVIIHWNHL